jgi:chromosomal replication initiator protein
MQRAPLTFARFVACPENRSALLAVQEVAASICARRPVRFSPLFIHGPAGCGKTHLTSALVDEVTRNRLHLAVHVLSARVFGDTIQGRRDFAEFMADISGLSESDLAIVEDLQHLSPRAAESLVQILDNRQTHGRPTVCTATTGLQALHWRGERLPARLTSRLAGGLVVGVQPLQAASRLAILEDKAQRQQLAVSREVLVWLAEHLGGGGRELEGALTQLQTLVGMHSGPLEVAQVATHFGQQARETEVTVERIVEQVSGFYRVPAGQLQSRLRSRKVLLPRQVSMYLARQLTPLSLGEIGSYFGGRDHSTVLHACRKMEQELEHDPVLSGAVQQLQHQLA